MYCMYMQEVHAHLYAIYAHVLLYSEVFSREGGNMPLQKIDPHPIKSPMTNNKTTDNIM